MLNRSRTTDRADRTTTQVTRRRRRVTNGRRRMIALGAAAVVLAGAGVTYASTEIFGHNQVGTEYANGIQVSDDQIIKPLGERLDDPVRQVHGLDGQPERAFLAATSTDKSVVLQIFDLSSYRLIWTVGTASGVNQRFTDGTVGQEGPTYSPDGKFLWLPEQNGLSPVPGQPRRHARHADHRPDPGGERPLRAGRPDQVLARRVRPVRRDQRAEHRRGARPQHRRGRAHVERRASPRVSSTSWAASST